MIASAEDHASTPLIRRAFRPVGERPRLRPLQLADADEANRDKLDRGSSVRVSVASFVRRMESLGDLVDERSSTHLVLQERDLKRVFLADVPDIDESLHSNDRVIDALCVQQAARSASSAA